MRSNFFFKALKLLFFFFVTGSKSGTSGMHRHNCPKDTGSKSLVTSFLQPAAAKVTQTDKTFVTDACISLCCQDLRPFEVVAGDGFMKYTQAILKLQHRHKTLLNAADILPHPTTISRNVKTKAEDVREDLQNRLQQAYVDGNVSYTSDMWTDAHGQRSYLTVTAHWITNDWKLHSQVISTEEFDPMEKKTGVNIRGALEEIFKSLNVTDEQLSRSVFTTDRGANMIAALKGDERIDCIAHILNTVLRNAFDDQKDCPKPVTELLVACKGLVRYIKKTSIQHLLTKNVVQSCETRWNSTYLMLKSVSDAFDNIKEVLLLHAYAELHRLTAINKILLDEIVIYLEVRYNHVIM